ncbi:serine protease [Rugosimonospora africana]|uniref:Serine protease n=1 Tax=Rugosimonospora africana TaxID=556532 RepID=A0A8J3VSG8_9ACTN|nr:serine protease [Rugosimonospora africana]
MTLVTGDRVTVASAGTGRVTISPGKSRERMVFSTYRVGSDLYVVPQDAVRLVGSGRVDRRLFDVSALVAAGYADDARDTLPLIVGYRSGTAQPAALAGHGARITRTLPAVGGAAVLSGKHTTGGLWAALTTGAGTARTDTAPGIDHIWLDGRRRIADDTSDQQIGAPVAWQAGYTGSGVTVAVLDSGIDATHPDLADRVVAERDFSADPNPADTVGHGTHVASIIAGTGAASGGQYRGVAPGAQLLDGKVCESDFCDESAILAGMQWAAADEHAKVVNLSIGGADTPEVDPLEAAVNDLTARYGTLFVIAAGNDGPAETTIESPGSADAALTVGAVDSTDQLADFSSRGPRTADAAIKPDLTAPGVDIVAARAAGTELGDPVGDSYVKLSGTSMATPHVTGSVAILAQEHPDWTAEQFKATLMASARPNPNLSVYQQGAGRVDIGRAIDQTLTAQPASLSMGLQQWPHTDDEPVTKTVTYHNAGSAPVTLTLSATVHASDGTAAPAGMFALSTNQLTVPAGGQAQVTLTADTRTTGPDGLYSGDLSATTAGGTRVSTPVGIDKESESYNLTITTIDRTGAPADNYLTTLQGTDAATHTSYLSPYDPSGTVTLRLPKGGYDLNSAVFTATADPTRPDASLLAQPVLNLTSDTRVVLDARTARPVTMTVPDTTVQPVEGIVGYDHITPYGDLSTNLFSSSFTGVSAAQQGPTLPSSQLLGNLAGQWAAIDQDGASTRAYYCVAEFPAGGLPTGFVKHYTRQDLAQVHAGYGAQPGDAGYVSALGTSPLTENRITAAVPIALPGTLTEYFNAGRWNTELDTHPADSDDLGTIDARLGATATYQAGQQYREGWNTAPFGPALPTGPFPSDFMTRQGDTLLLAPQPFSDAAGHYGQDVTGDGSTTVYRDGTRIAQVPGVGGQFPVPADAARYRVEIQATRTGFGGLSSTVQAAWTFRSGHVNGTDPAPLPAMAVRFTPQLDAHNQAPAGRFTIPVAIQYQPGSAPATIRNLTLAVSYDDGKTWQPVELDRGADHWTATLTHPAGGGYVSLRADATDSAGNNVQQTIIHAYALSG